MYKEETDHGLIQRGTVTYTEGTDDGLIQRNDGLIQRASTTLYRENL